MRLGERLKTIIIGVAPCPEIPFDPSRTIFPRFKREFPQGEEYGISGKDLHNAVWQGAIRIGTVLGITRHVEPGSNEKSKLELAYAGTDSPFIDPKTRDVNHLFFDSRASNGSSIIPIRGITGWKKTGTLSQENCIRLKQALNNLNQKNNKK
ncbi:MAG: hypothetical protein AAB675_05005 [Patescibacteria group bacterium]